jgi:hypothetical protein
MKTLWLAIELLNIITHLKSGPFRAGKSGVLKPRHIYGPLNDDLPDLMQLAWKGSYGPRSGHPEFSPGNIEITGEAGLLF